MNAQHPDTTAAMMANAQQPDKPAIALPKGGGAIRGIGEKFAANPVTGTGSLSVPIATSPGRAGFGPQLSLAYDSGAGNGPFGLGWSLSLPSITRKTDKGLPRYLDAAESDEFLLSGAEDLVPSEEAFWRPVNGKRYTIQRYRPRLEGLFARIERWTRQDNPKETFWHSISRDNITTWYGTTDDSRIADPTEASRIFSWLICESYDDKGNVIVYHYKPEDSTRVGLSQAHESNRTAQNRAAQRYLKSIRYGNHTPYFPQLLKLEPWPTPPGATTPDGSLDWFFEVVFDYGEHDLQVPTPNDAGPWECRPDPFSSYRAGFEVRTYRLCQRVLMFHHDEGEAGRIERRWPQRGKQQGKVGGLNDSSQGIADAPNPLALWKDRLRDTGSLSRDGRTRKGETSQSNLLGNDGGETCEHSGDTFTSYSTIAVSCPCQQDVLLLSDFASSISCQPGSLQV